MDAQPGGGAAPILRLAGVSVRRGGHTFLGPIDWIVARRERWVVLGPNGSGKTTLLEVAGASLWPTTGAVEVLGERLGEVDARELRRRVGYAGSAPDALIPPALSAHDVVMTARHAAFEPWWHTWERADHRRADELLERFGLGAFGSRTFGTLSAGERRRVLVARSLMPDPEILLLDEPAASLDLGARERLVRNLATLAADASLPAIVLVTHHVEEIPPGFTHALVVRAGRAVAAGPIETALTGTALSEAFDLAITLDCRDGRYSARADGD